MGKKHFSSMYRRVKESLAAAGKDPAVKISVKISHFSDRFDPNKDYAGVIIYHWEGNVKWYNGKIGHRGQSFYVYLVCTDKFQDKEFREAGQGRVHHTAVERIMGIDFQENKACLGGFSVRKGATSYSSVWLNTKTNTSFSIPWESDGSKLLSEAEKVIVDLAVSEWKARGTNKVVEIPPEMDQKLSSDAFWPATVQGSTSALCCRRCNKGDLVDLGLAPDDDWVVEEDWDCDHCGDPGEGMHRWRCERCDFNLCSACYDREVQEQGAKAKPVMKANVGGSQAAHQKLLLEQLKSADMKVLLGCPFRLRSEASPRGKELFLQVQGDSQEEGAAVELWERLEGLGQQWVYDRATQTIRNRKSGKGLDAWGGFCWNGARIHTCLLHNPSQKHQQWRIEHGPRDLVKLVGVGSNKPIHVAMELGVSLGVSVHLWDDVDVPQVWWRLQFVQP